jgi:transposase
MSMRKKVIADNVIKLLKKGYSPKEITERMAVSYNYAWKLKKDLEAAAKDTLETVRQTAVEHTDKIKEMVEDWRAEAEKDWRSEVDTDVDAILDERAATYGSFSTQAAIAQSIKEDIRVALNARGRVLSPDQHEALDMIAGKIARIVNGNPTYVDSWIDIAGYATLVADRLQGKIR